MQVLYGGDGKMINDRLRQINAESESNTKQAEKALKGEKIVKVFKPDDWTTIYLMESGCAFERKSDGAFRIISSKLFMETFPLVKNELKENWEEYEEIKDIIIKKEEEK